MSQSLIYHGGSSLTPKFSTSGGGSVPATARGVIPNFEYTACNIMELSAFGQFTAMKLVATVSGIISGMSVFIWNAQGDRLFDMGIYTRFGVLIDSIGQTQVAANVNTQAGWLFQGGDVTVAAGTEYWLGVWGDQVYLPTLSTSFANFGSTFPSQTHCIRRSAIPGGLPATFDNTPPYFLATNPIALQVG